MNKDVRARDYLLATSLSALASAGRYVPKVREWIGDLDDVRIAPAQWRFTGLAATDIHPWVRYEGISHSGRLPRGYAEVGLLAVAKAELDEIRDTTDGKLAVAYQLGSAAMVGVLPESRPFGSLDDDYAVGMRIGRGTLIAAMGVFDESGAPHGALIVPQSLHERGRSELGNVSAQIPVV